MPIFRKKKSKSQNSSSIITDNSNGFHQSGTLLSRKDGGFATCRQVQASVLPLQPVSRGLSPAQSKGSLSNLSKSNVNINFLSLSNQFSNGSVSTSNQKFQNIESPETPNESPGGDLLGLERMNGLPTVKTMPLLDPAGDQGKFGPGDMINPNPAVNLLSSANSGPVRSKSVQHFQKQLNAANSKSQENLAFVKYKSRLSGRVELSLARTPSPGAAKNKIQTQIQVSQSHLNNGNLNKPSRSRFPIVGSTQNSQMSSTASLCSDSSIQGQYQKNHIQSQSIQVRQGTGQYIKYNQASKQKPYNSLGNLNQKSTSYSRLGPHYSGGQIGPSRPGHVNHGNHFNQVGLGGVEIGNILSSTSQNSNSSSVHSNLTTFIPRRGPTLPKRSNYYSNHPGKNSAQNGSNSNSNSSNQSNSNINKEYLRHRDSLPSYGHGVEHSGDHHFRTKSDIISEGVIGEFLEIKGVVAIWRMKDTIKFILF